MHYHYFTLEQRDALSRQIHETKDGPAASSALASLRSPDYGICEACEADIAFALLLEDPLRRLCGRCGRR